MYKVTCYHGTLVGTCDMNSRIWYPIYDDDGQAVSCDGIGECKALLP